ncbi:MAG: lipocalin family protein, partial [Rhodothermales bacterium]
SESLTLTITPYLPDQEMETSVRYWEGAVRIEGTSGEKNISGSGYIEMTGYGDNKAQPTS